MAKSRFRDIKQGKVKPKNIENKSKYNFAKRSDVFKAILTDSFMLWMPIVYLVIYFVMSGREGFAEHKLLGWLYIFIPLAIVESIFLLKNAQTPGMKAYNLKLIFLPTGQKPNFSTILLRQLLSKLTFILLGWVILFFRKDGRNLHDLIVSTAFIYDKK